MEQIKIFIEELASRAGMADTVVPFVRHTLLVAITLILAALSDWICRRFFVPAILRITRKTETKWDDTLLNERVLTSACHIIPAIIIWQLLPLVFCEFPIAREILSRLTAVYITFMAARTAIVFINSLQQMDTGRRSSAQQYLHTFCGVLKILTVFIATIVVVAIILDKSPMTLFAGLGATSAILMLVFKDTIEGVVAGVRLTSNDMLHKGDWITVPKASANGIVEEMTLTTVKIRNFDNTIITVSPKTLVDDSFQNWIGMQQSSGRRVSRKVYFDFRSICPADDLLRQRLADKHYLTAEETQYATTNMSLYRKYTEKYLAGHNDVDQSQPIMVKQLEATNTGLPLEFYFFLKHKEAIGYEHSLADLMEYLYATAPDFGLTIYQKYSSI